MSRYTTQVRYIVETSAGLEESVGYSKIEETIAKSLPVVFDFDFPIFDETYRSVLETKILRHYYTREIAHETVGLWKFKLSTKLNEILPYYNQLYKSQLLEFNPLYDVDLTRTRKGDSSGKKNTTTTNNSTINMNATNNETADSNLNNNSTTNATGMSSDIGKNKEMYSETPQGAITDLEAGRYLTSANIKDNNNTVNTKDDTTVVDRGDTHSERDTRIGSDTTNTGTGTNNTDITNLENYIETVKGKQGTQDYSELLMKFRQTFLNIDMMIINDLSELFFGLWA